MPVGNSSCQIKDTPIWEEIGGGARRVKMHGAIALRPWNAK
jgi:hypothetical protein